MPDSATAFVIMPFDSEFDAAYRLFIKEALLDAGYKVVRADDILSHRSILHDVVSSLANADLVVADLTSSNPNVFYELGIAHALRKKTVLLTQSVEDLPFDLQSYRVLPYDTHFARIDDAKEKLSELARAAHKGELLFGNPVTDYYSGIQQQSNEHTELPGAAPEPEAEDDRGFLDHLIDITESYAELTEVVRSIAEAHTKITPQTASFARIVKEIGKTGGREAAARLRVACQPYSKALRSYADALSSANGRYETTQSLVQTSLEYVVTYQSRLNSKDGQADNYLEKMETLRGITLQSREAYQSIRDRLNEQKDIERSIKRATMAAAIELDRLIGNMSVTISSLDRALLAAGRKQVDSEQPNADSGDRPMT